MMKEDKKSKYLNKVSLEEGEKPPQLRKMDSNQ